MTGHISIRAELYQPNQDKTATLQAQRVFQLLVAELKADNQLKIAILYAANNNQSMNFYEQYAQGSLYVPSGSNQADFFNKFNTLVNQAVADGQLNANQIKVLPIATSLTGGDNTPGNQVNQAQLDRDLDFVEAHLKAGYTVYGFRGVDTQTKQVRYAIGGGVSTGFYRNDGSFPSINGASQGAYVQKRLADFEAAYNDVDQDALDDSSLDDLLQEPRYQKPKKTPGPDKKDDSGTKPDDKPRPDDESEKKDETTTSKDDKPDTSSPAAMQQACLLAVSLLLIAGGAYYASTILIGIGVATLIYDAYLFACDEPSSLFSVRF